MATNTIDNSREVTMQPFVEIKERFKTIKNIHFVLKGRIVDGTGKITEVHQFGEAYVQLFNQDWVPEAITDYIDSIIGDFSGVLKIHYQNLKLMLETVDLEKMQLTGTIAYLHSILIHPLLRKQGLGKVYLQLIMECLKQRYKPNFLMLESTPYELNKFDEMYDTELHRLESMYSHLGFTKIKTKGVSRHYMYMKLK